MKFIIDRDQLLTAVQNVMKAISPRTVVPILTGIKLEVRQDGITLTGSDADISIESYIPAEEDGMVYIDYIEEGNIVLHSKYFPDIVRKLPENKVEIEADENLKITIRSGKAKFNLNGQDALEYPQLPSLLAADSFEIPIDLLKSLIKQTVFAVSTMETRPILTGVNMKLIDQTLTFSATDSHRLASRTVPIAETGIDFSNVVVPGKSLNELNKIIDDSEEKIQISVTSNQILFRTKRLQFLSRLLDGNYPETSRLIPTQSKTVLYFNTKELLHTIDRASLLAREERNNVVRLTTKENNMVEIASNHPEVGNVTEEIAIASKEGEDLKISFSSKYMMDALKAIDYDEVKIEFTGAMRPFIIHPVEDDSILQLILPVRTF
ncbi:DNA polymerase III subunit beta [Virgibacillus proomii]|uniref:DNA polymerase III subunit beta n=1 Tax=Virgibacillus proomii TaxID=84407 RepID=UPI001C116787|nr:DNA polymerase III subunit beta [Virgibacillus proomii]MBU5268178.1 DNA polymerase III subunit beta [Virgibacillus proomii]